MSPHTTSKPQQGHYRYDPTVLDQAGPARLFSHIGEDGIARYVLTQLGQAAANQGKLSHPLSLLNSQLKRTVHKADELWSFITTRLVDLEIFQSGWFNFDLPPDEQFGVEFVRDRRDMIEALLSAQAAAKKETQLIQARARFYEILEQHQRSRPVVAHIHEREGGLSDREFARQRLAGQNPMVLRRIQSTDRPLLQSWANLECLLSNGDRIDLEQAATADRLFVAAYPLLQSLSIADLQPGRYVGSPVALFHRTQNELEPLLIQLENGCVVTPHNAKGDSWMQAKLFVQVADVTHHELIVHLCDTHLAMEAFAIATPRQLPATHPLYRLLRPHFQFLLAINSRGNTVLLGEGAAIDRLMAPTLKASIGLINRAYREQSFGDYALPKNIRQRGVESDFLPEFPYRDDALLLWDAIHRYTTQFLQQYYPTDESVRQDLYVQAWAAELGSSLSDRPTSDFPQAPSWLPPDAIAQAGLALRERPDYVRVPGFPTELSTLQALVDITTQLIFTCGPQHAAVNFSQFDYVGYTPNAPLAAYCHPNRCASVEQLLPPLRQDLGQIELSFALSGIRWGRLGSSDLIDFKDVGDRQVLEQFRTDLVAIEQEISYRNQKRIESTGIAYPYLLPSRIPNSINI
ncbi:lipoxygenase [Phormidium sp. CLA17]|uniref:lipoxygenase family protein n=1 Tax=Leptolyngbya sp. Cla-17 TaxID=2803751 RepID=UPI0014916668|nr:lipoxygenase family protein [Leptolyngbya sp. Cla-17]MBM0743226.1 lipoxygenase [Leptolyngbya sp. Cla-17]